MAAPVLDQHGHATQTGGTTATIPVTTGAANTLVLVAATVGTTSTSLKPSLSISGAGLTWTPLDASGVASGFGSGSFGVTVQCWWAFASAQLTSQTVTVTSSVTIDDAALVYASFTGANSATPIETHSVTARFQTASAVLTTALTSINADDIGVAIGGTNTNLTFSVSSPNVLIDSIQNAGGSQWAFNGIAYQTFSSAQTGVAVGFSTSAATSGLIGVMITADPYTPPPTYGQVSQVAVEEWGGGGQAQVTQVAVEEWGGGGQAQITQLALEVWATTATGSTQALITQVALEEWTATQGAAALNRVSTLFSEVIADVAPPSNRVSTLFAEAIAAPIPPSNRVSTLFKEVIADPSTPGPANRVSTVFSEVIADMRKVPIKEGAFLLVGI